MLKAKPQVLIDLSDFNETEARRDLIDDVHYRLDKFHDYNEDSPFKLSWFLGHLRYNSDYDSITKNMLIEELKSLDDPEKNVFVKIGDRDWWRKNEG
jgi:hypothetical protein